MFRLFAWPQLSTAGAFVTAVAVVLNPITPVLPDITVPALFPPAVQHQPARAVPQAPIPAVAPVSSYPPVAIAAAPSGPSPGIRWQPAIPDDIPAAAAPIVSPVLAEPAIEIGPRPVEFRGILPAAAPAIHAGGPPIGMVHAGDRPRISTPRPPFATRMGGQRPLPAAAVDPEDSSPPASSGADGVQQRARGGASRTDPSDAAPRGHRGTAAERP